MILINGCSFSAPTDTGQSWSEGFLEKGFSKNYIKNMAVGGSGNTLIRRKTFWYLNNQVFNTIPDYAIIQWSTIDRWDYPIFVDKERAKTFPRIRDMRPDWVGNINYMCNGTDTFSYGKHFYENYYSFYGAVIETLENIYHTQQYLKDKNIPYKMITIGNLFDMDVSIEKLINLQTDTTGDNGNYAVLKTNKSIFEKLEPITPAWYELDIIKELLEKIDFSKFLFTDNINISGFGGGIIEWFLNKNENLVGGRWHPSQEQHLRFFDEFLWPHIKEEVEQFLKK